jgi:hypothetical protein
MPGQPSINDFIFTLYRYVKPLKLLTLFRQARFSPMIWAFLAVKRLEEAS